MKSSIMKSIALTLAGLLFITLSQAQTAEQNRSLSSFSGIHQSTSADVYITKGDSETVLVRADEDAIDNITTEVRDGVLHIGSTKKGWKNVRVMEVHITMRSLDKIKNSGSGDISVKGTMPGNDLYIGISGSGDLSADLKVTNVEVSISGSGDVSFSGVRGNMKVKVSGSGDVYAEDLQLDECMMTGYGSGDMKIKGKAANFVANLSGSGDVNAYGLTAVNVSVKCNGSGDVVVQAVERVQAKLNGSGDLTYYGSPEYVDVEANGSGEVYRK